MSLQKKRNNKEQYMAVKKRKKSFDKHICFKCLEGEANLQLRAGVTLSCASCQICSHYLVGAKAKYFKKEER